MSRKKSQQKIQLEKDYGALLDWAYERNGRTPFRNTELWLKRYPNWESLCKTLVAFLETKQTASWTRSEARLVDSLVDTDMHSYMLFRKLDEKVFCQLTLGEFPLERLRKHFLHCTYFLHDKSTKEKIYVHYLLNDSDGGHKVYAFRKLADMGWEGTEDYAKVLWDSGDEYLQGIAWEGLFAIDSPNYEKLLNQALNSTNELLVVKAECWKLNEEHMKGARRPYTCVCHRCKSWPSQTE